MNDITVPARYGFNEQRVFTNQPDGEYVSYQDYLALLDEIKHMQDQAIDDGCRIAELEEALRDKQALIPDEFDTINQQFESLAKSE